MKIPHILLVEDNPADADLMEEAFTEANFECNLSVVHDGAQAIEFINRLDQGLAQPGPDLVVLDLNLPKVSGHMVLEKVRSSRTCKEAMVLVVSSSDAPTDRKQVMDLGADGYFRKPSSLEQFMEIGPKIQTMLREGKRRHLRSG